MLGPFRSRDFRFQWPADLLTSLAFEMEVLILGWYVLVTTGSVFWLTVFGALNYLGTLLAPAIGVLGDRIGLRNLLCLMRAAYAGLAGVLTFLFITEQATLVLIFIVAGLLGVVRPSDIGIRSALVAHIIPGHQLSGALALSRMTSDLARITGALTGAGLFAMFGIEIAYVVVSGAYILGLLLTTGISSPAHAVREIRRSPLGDLVDGLFYIWRTPHILAAMCVACLVNLTAFPQSIGLLPYVAKNVYGIDQTGLGMLTASFAVGALLGSIILAALRNAISSGRVMIASCASWHVCLIVFAFTTTNIQGMAILFLAGFSQSLSMVSLVMMLLKTTDPSIQGRIMGVRMLAIYTLPIGLLLAGVLIPTIGYVATAAGYAATGLFLTLLIAVVWRRSVWATSGAANA
jgi:predicted MFS family arabinose efflux permease